MSIAQKSVANIAEKIPSGKLTIRRTPLLPANKNCAQASNGLEKTKTKVTKMESREKVIESPPSTSSEPAQTLPDTTENSIDVKTKSQQLWDSLLIAYANGIVTATTRNIPPTTNKQ